MPLNVLWACGHLVTGAVGYALRLTALGLKVASCFADGSRSVSRRRRKHDIETKIRLPLQKAVRRSPTRSPPQIGCPKESGRFCGCAASSPEASDWENRGPGGPRRRFGYFAAEGKVTRAYGAEYPQTAWKADKGAFGGTIRRNAPPVPPAKQNSAFASQRDKGAKDLCGTTLLAPETGATQACDVTVTPGGAYWGCGGKPAGLVGAAAPRGSSRRAASSALPPKRAALCGGHAGYSSLSTQLSRIAIPYYRQFPDLSTTFPGKKAPVRSNPAHKAVKGATVTRPMEPTTVWISSEATYL